MTRAKLKLLGHLKPNVFNKLFKHFCRATSTFFQKKLDFYHKTHPRMKCCAASNALYQNCMFSRQHTCQKESVLPSRALFEKDKNQQDVVVVCIEDGKTMDRVMHQSLFMPLAVTNLFLAPTYYAFKKAQFAKCF